jgi:hypothetical protein
LVNYRENDFFEIDDKGNYVFNVDKANGKDLYIPIPVLGEKVSALGNDGSKNNLTYRYSVYKNDASSFISIDAEPGKEFIGDDLSLAEYKNKFLITKQLDENGKYKVGDYTADESNLYSDLRGVGITDHARIALLKVSHFAIPRSEEYTVKISFRAEDYSSVRSSPNSDFTIKFKIVSDKADFSEQAE